MKKTHQNNILSLHQHVLYQSSNVWTFGGKKQIAELQGMYANPEYCLVIDGDEFANGSKIQLWKCLSSPTAFGKSASFCGEGSGGVFFLSVFFLVEVSNH